MTEKEKIAHVLRRFCLGASEAEMDFFVPLGLQGTINHLVRTAAEADNWDIDPMEFANRAKTVNLRVAQGLWYLRLISTDRPFKEKLTLFWHNHFAVSAQKVTNSYVMMNHVDVLRENALGKFEDMLIAISKDPAMLFWLDNNLNVKGKPNENYAREVLELFTLGVGNYTEKDIQEAARAFTGWGYGTGFRAGSEAEPKRREKFIFSEARHDNGEKTILGKTGNFNGDDVLKFLCEMPRTAEFIATKMWKFFAHETPDTKVVEKLAAKYRASGLNTLALAKAIMESPEFYAESVVRRQVKSPIDFTISSARQLGAGPAALARVQQGRDNPQVNEQNGINNVLVRALSAPFALLQSTKAMGMELMYPPDVAGWGYGSYWISSATMVSRMAWSDRLFLGGTAGQAVSLGAVQGGNRGPSVGADAWALFSDDASMEGVVNRMISLFDVNVTPKVKGILLESIEAKSGGTVTRANANDVARAVARLICGLPEHQMN